MAPKLATAKVGKASKKAVTPQKKAAKGAIVTPEKTQKIAVPKEAAAKPKRVAALEKKAAGEKDAEPAPSKRGAATVGKARAKAASATPERKIKTVIPFTPKSKMTTDQWHMLQEGMDKKWPAPAYMAVERDDGRCHGGTSYRSETYEAITLWYAHTKIAYRPHAKRPGTMSHDRYETYSTATTVAEALSFGSLPADWCWDYERGFIKVLGLVRDEPLDISKVQDEGTLTDVDTTIYRWFRRELAKNLGLDYKDLSVGKNCGESTMMRAHRLVAQRDAKKRLESAAKEGRQITEDEVLKTLQQWDFAKNPNRQNVMPNGQDWVWSDTLGLLRDRIGDIHLTSATKAYPAVVEILNKYLTDRLPADIKGKFKWTSLNLNCDYAGRLHRDGNNFGPSFIKAFGDFTGGQLNNWPEDDRKVDKLENLKPKDSVQFDISKGLALFNGNCGHSVEDFQGHRFSVVYFACGCFAEAPEECKKQLAALGFSYPSEKEDRYTLLRPPLGYSKPEKATSKLPAYRYLPDSEVRRDVAAPAPTHAAKRSGAADKVPAAKRQRGGK